MLNILKNITSLTKKKPFFTYVIVCLLILLYVNSNYLQIIEGKRQRIKKSILKKDIENNTDNIEKNKKQINTIFSKLNNKISKLNNKYDNAFIGHIKISPIDKKYK